MALGKEIGEFSFQITSVGYAGDEGKVDVNVDGTATSFGTVLGTMTFAVQEPGAKSGALSWRGQGFLENGENVVGIGEGAWEEIGKHQWSDPVWRRYRLADGHLKPFAEEPS